MRVEVGTNQKVRFESERRIFLYIKSIDVAKHGILILACPPLGALGAGVGFFSWMIKVPTSAIR